MTDIAGMRLTRLGIVMLVVQDLNRALTFYRDALGLALQSASGEFAFFDGGGVTLCLRREAAEPTDRAGRESPELVFTVDDVDAAHRALGARGVVFRVEPRIVSGDRYAADFRDPDGHVLSIFGPRVTV